jgi:hypothetical protein
MIRSDQGDPISMKESLPDLKLMVEVDVIEVQQGQDRRIPSSATNVVPQVGEMKLGGERSRD